MGTDDTTPVRGSDSKAEIRLIIETYFDGLHANDVSDVPFTDDVVWENPVTRREGAPIRGREHVVEALEQAARNMPQIDIERHVIDGQTACTVLEWENRDGIVFPTVDYFEFDNGAISAVRTYLDLSPIQK